MGVKKALCFLVGLLLVGGLAFASGVPIAAFAVGAPRDVIGDAEVGALDSDLGAACRKALTLSREACRRFALTMTWRRSARCFIANVRRCCIGPRAPRHAEPRIGVAASLHTEPGV